MRLRYTRPALADLSHILDYISERSPQGAQRVQQRLQAILELLTLHPHIGRPTNRPGIRRIVMSPYPYLVFYEATRDEVIIHAVRHSARNPSSMPGGGR